MKGIIRILATLVAAALLVGCVGDDGESAQSFDSTEYALDETLEVALVAFLNDQAHTTFERLDIECGIRSDSARNIIEHRDGEDEEPDTADDDLFDSAQEIYDVRMVGPWTMGRLVECAVDLGYLAEDPEPPGEETSEWVYNMSAVDPALLELINGDLLTLAKQHKDPNANYEVFFAQELQIFSVDGIPVRYEIPYYQTLDAEGGIQLWIKITLDADYQVLETKVYI
ncbi:MAG: hypothetical protein JRI68_06330 [Deltaproteobacteria bacterium]|nr:hypothetical protein [Deltaproteobacteria bacterium]